MKKILFLIHDLGHGGAEKVLVNLVNHLDPEKFHITVMALFGGGVNEQFLKKHVRYIPCFPREVRGNSHLMKLFTPRQLHRWLIRERYDMEISYLEGPSARIISGCADPDTRLVSWIHCTMDSEKKFSQGFRSVREARSCYRRFHRNVFVSQGVMDAFGKFCTLDSAQILYNTNESMEIQQKANGEVVLPGTGLRWCGIGKLVEAKGFDRMLRIQKRLQSEGYALHLRILGEGPQRERLEEYARELGIADCVTFLGYQTNPYKYVAKCDLFVCASHAEGFSTAATEALILGIPVCTVEVSGMKEMLGQQNEYGMVTENSEEALYRGIRSLLEDPKLLAHYRQQARLRGRDFSTLETVRAVENMLLEL